MLPSGHERLYERGVNAPLFHPLRSAGLSRFRLDSDPGLPLLALLVAGMLLVRIAGLALSNAELFYDEAQYWAWAQEPAFGYYTKPPLIAWLIGATTALCGDSAFCVRLPSPVLHGAIALIVYALAVRLHSRHVAFWAALIYASMPGTSISSTLMSTDVPLLLFWSLALLALTYHVERPRLWTGLLLGAALGLGLNAKYAMGFFVVCYAAYTMVAADARATLRHAGTWIGLALALALIAPNLAWNAQHQFATFEHTGANADWGGRFPNLMGLLAFIGTQAAIIGPVPFAAYVIACAKRTEHSKEGWLFGLAMSAPVFVLISAQALISKANGNWAATAFPAAVVIAAAVLIARGWRRGMMLTLAISGVCLVAIAFSGALAGRVTTGPVGRELSKMAGWAEFAEKVRELADRSAIKTVVFRGRGLTASMIYELRDAGLDIRAYSENRERPSDHFEMTRSWTPADPGPVLLVLAGAAEPPKALAGRMRLVETFKTRVFIARGADWNASAYRVD